MKIRTYSVIIGLVILIIVGALYFSQERMAATTVVGNTPSEVSIPEISTTKTVTALESNVEIGTEGFATNVDVSGAAFDEPVLITFETDGDSLHTIAVPTIELPLCAAYGKIADVNDILIGDRLSVRGMTDEDGRLVPCDSDLHFLTISTVYTDETTGLTFVYRKSPDGYLREGDEYKISTDPNFVTGVALTTKKGALELLLSDVPRELPPSIKLRVYKNSEEQSPLEWAKANAVESNYALALFEPAEISVGKREAVGFTADGLYMAKIYIVAFGENILTITGEYLEEDSMAYRDIEQIVNTVSFSKS
ncbi:hypothetical protein GW937_01595 [Candidatus Kaiserbacteria bacterium]|nr:hypothetical protein [Candidatus Kaiserbacteria bacterium]NCT01707.1 hypothetical protein [Candidatus Parcubacteria bacterium]